METPEQQARDRIDALLSTAGWTVADALHTQDESLAAH